MSEDNTLRRIVVLCADVSGSTQLYERLGDAPARADIAACLVILSAAAAHFSGRTIKTIGDEVVCVFPSPSQAAAAAARMHADLRKAGTAGRFRSGLLRVKIGCHYGSGAWRDGELVGDAPIVAQQIIRLAKPEEILFSGHAVAALTEAERAAARTIETIESELDGDPIEVCTLQWEDDEDVTHQRTTPPPPRARPSTRLLLEYDGATLKLDDDRRRCRIGRTDDNDLVVHGRFTSRHHAEITFRHGRFYLRDASINGTVVNPRNGRAQRLHREEAVLTGDGTLEFGGGSPDAGEVVAYRCR